MTYRLTIAEDFSAKVEFGSGEGDDFLPTSYINIPSYAYLRPDWSGDHFTSNEEVDSFVSAYADQLRDESVILFTDDEETIDEVRYCITYTAKEKEVRIARDGLLGITDWTQVSDNSLTDELRTAWATYRTALRDISSHANWPFIQYEDWPTKP